MAYYLHKTAKPNLLNKCGKSAALLAKGRGNEVILRMLIQHGAHIELPGFEVSGARADQGFADDESEVSSIADTGTYL